MLGTTVGIAASPEGFNVKGTRVGIPDGKLVGELLGDILGDTLGSLDGTTDGLLVGLAVGDTLDP